MVEHPRTMRYEGCPSFISLHVNFLGNDVSWLMFCQVPNSLSASSAFYSSGQMTQASKALGFRLALRKSQLLQKTLTFPFVVQ